jgi:hypothetical protein
MNAAPANNNNDTNSGSGGPRKASNPLLSSNSDENQVLWGAAWHNLGVAQINTAQQAKKAADPADHTNALVIFQNAIKATTELLGPDHSMTKAVLMTYRAIRPYLRDKGVFKQHPALLTCGLPPVTATSTSYPDPEPERGQSLHSARRQHAPDLRVTIRPPPSFKNSSGGNRSDAAAIAGVQSGSLGGTNTNRTVEIHSREAYPISAAGPDARVRNFSGTYTSPRGPISPRRKNELRGLPVSGLLLHATALYANPHPLMHHLSSREHMFVNTTSWESSTVLLSDAIMSYP